MTILIAIAWSFILLLLAWRLERAIHFSFIGAIRAEKYYKEIYIIKYDWKHSILAALILNFIGWLNFNEMGVYFYLILMPLFFLIGIVAAFDYRMRLIPDRVLALIFGFGVLIWVYCFYVSSDFDWASDLYIKAVFVALALFSLFLYFTDRFDIGLGDIKLFIALIPLPYQMLDLSLTLLFTGVFSIIYLLFSKERGVPVGTMVGLSIITITLLPLLN